MAVTYGDATDRASVISFQISANDDAMSYPETQPKSWQYSWVDSLPFRKRTLPDGDTLEKRNDLEWKQLGHSSVNEWGSLVKDDKCAGVVYGTIFAWENDESIWVLEGTKANHQAYDALVAKGLSHNEVVREAGARYYKHWTMYDGLMRVLGDQFVKRNAEGEDVSPQHNPPLIKARFWESDPDVDSSTVDS
ncbi:uncharacterized protein Aud_006911 [Neofusicoccum parvum]|nr:uncharacterized protein Aud_006911 [Neofusicoccum parvum]